MSSPAHTETSPDDEVVIRGSIERITYHNSENGFSVLQLRVLEQTELIPVVGAVADIQIGQELVVRGSYTEHPKFGRQIKAASIEVSTPTTPEGIERYIGSGLIKGIGPKTAARIVERFGNDTLEIIHNYPEKLARVPGIGRHKAKLISAAFADQKEAGEVMRFLVERNISTGLASRIYKMYGTKSIEVLKRDPYLLAREMKGIGFATADSLALNLGLATNSPQRLKAGVYYALERARDDGHCYLPEEHLLARAADLLDIEDPVTLLPHIASLVQERFLHRSEEKIYLEALFHAEQFVAQFVAARCKPFEMERISIAQINHSLEKAAKELGITFSTEQRQAVYYATQFPLLVLTGGPGCGKTTVIKALVATFQDAKCNLALAAPTGRAAQRMAQVSSMPSRTIHRLLRFDPLTGGFIHGINDPLEVDGEPVDVVIIDEASMIDIQLAKDLFSAIPPGATLILVGDKDQLPSVGPGRVFGDLLSVPEVQSISLSQLFRRSQESTINSIAHNINAGIVPDIPQPDGETKVDAYFLPKRDAEDAAALVEKLVADQLPKKFGFHPSDIVVLTPSNRGPLGTAQLNERLQTVLNPDQTGTKAQEIQLPSGLTLRYQDRVCQRVNNYNLDSIGVFNGDVGTIYEVNPADRTLTVELWDGRLINYDKKAVGQLSHAYAMTVHRSQGSEIPCVVLVLHESHYTLLERQLIYTGVTRAKKLLVVVGSPKALKIATQRMSAKRRCTALHERISSSALKRFSLE